MQPRSEMVHWLFAAGFLLLGLCLLAETIVGTDVWRRRRWRAYLWPSLAFAIGLLLFPVMVFFASSTVHMLAHGAWAQVAMLAGATQLALVHGKLRSRWWTLVVSLALLVSGLAFLVHEQNPWLFSRSAFLHHAMGWTAIGAAVIPVGQTLRPRSPAWNGAFALVFVVFAVFLFSDRDLAPIFGHLSDVARASARP